MPISRYSKAPRLDLGSSFGTSVAIQNIRAAIKDGSLQAKEVILRGAERLDTMSGVIYGDSRYWWVLAAASNIGWGLQVPAGTIIRIPDLAAVTKLVSG